MQHRLCRRRQGGCGTRILLSTDFPIPSACRRSAKSKSRFSPCRWRGKVAAEQGFSSPLVCSLCLPAINEIKRPLFALPLARQGGCGTRIRTLTGRFRDCSATLTQFRNMVRRVWRSIVYYTRFARFVKCFAPIIFKKPLLPRFPRFSAKRVETAQKFLLQF